MVALQLQLLFKKPSIISIKYLIATATKSERRVIYNGKKQKKQVVEYTMVKAKINVIKPFAFVVHFISYAPKTFKGGKAR